MSAITSPRDERIERMLDHFWETIPAVWGRVRAHIRAVATEKHDISVEQFHILRYIRRGLCSVSELAEARHISRPAISQGVDLLVNKGLISRTTNAGDRRYVELELTPVGEALLEAVFQDTRAWMKTSLVALTPDEIEDAMRGMAALKHMVDETHP